MFHFSAANRRRRELVLIFWIKRCATVRNRRPKKAPEMSNRGSIITTPDAKNKKLVCESASYIPLFWFALLPEESWSPDEPAYYKCPRKETIQRGTDRLDFLADVFSDIACFAESAQRLLDRLSRLRCETIGIDVAELAEPDPPNPDLGVALETVASRNNNYRLSIPARKAPNPFLLGEMSEFPAREFGSTRDLLLWVSSISTRELERATRPEVLAGYVVGHIWD
ncbi:hypothetical protein Pan97_35770 [Bremerella volcania]|uniref:Uncharacterized protein n=1 Tax=Bremerella volcania TaxID=2527984 RepID=A0A518CBB7_9BACT|nr:hypothetical protein [Bremerella volcania]QDU76525.1 hypothetical protein Pan97_35770 [Bremerella volcania]